MFTSGFDLYCLHEAAPGSSHTGYYIITFDFVYVGNPHGNLQHLVSLVKDYSIDGRECITLFLV